MREDKSDKPLFYNTPPVLPDRYRLCLRPSMFEFIRFLKSTVITYIKTLGSLCFKVQMEYKKYI